MFALCCCAMLAAGASAPVAAGDPVPLELPPVTRLVLRLHEGVGAVSARVRLELDPSVSADEADAVAREIGRAGLLLLDDAAPLALLLRRPSPAAVTAEVRDAGGAVVWQGEVEWPQTAAVTPAPAPRPAPRPRLSVESSSSTRWGIPVLLGGGYGRESATAGLGPGTSPAPLRATEETWLIVKDGEQVIDELELADLLGDGELRRAIEERRLDARLRWGLGFGVAAAVGLGSGAAVAFATQVPNPADRQTLETLGVSLLVAGGVSTIVALLFPFVDGEPVLSRSEAERRIQERDGAGVTPSRR